MKKIIELIITNQNSDFRQFISGSACNDRSISSNSLKDIKVVAV